MRQLREERGDFKICSHYSNVNTVPNKITRKKGVIARSIRRMREDKKEREREREKREGL
jgi:hypothetical protein